MNEANDVLRAELTKLGLGEVKEVRYNLNIAELVTESLSRGETKLADTGALVVNTSPFTGRSPNDKYLIENGDPIYGLLPVPNRAIRSNMNILKQK